jgi:hypothetical protein
MASRTYNQFQGTLQKGVVTLFAKLVPDGTGALEVVTSEVINALTSPVTINPSNGFVSGLTPALGGLGKYKLTLQDPYVRLLSATAVEVFPSFAGSAIVCAVTVDDVKNDTDPSLTVVFDGSPITALDRTILFTVTLANSTAL